MWKCCFWITEVFSFLVGVKHPVKGGKEESVATRKEERRSFGGKDKEGRKRTMKTAGKEKEVCVGMPAETYMPKTMGSVLVAYLESKLISRQVKEAAASVSCILMATWKMFWPRSFFPPVPKKGMSKQQKVKRKRWNLPLHCRRWKREHNLWRLPLQVEQNLLGSRWMLFCLGHTRKSFTLKWVWPELVFCFTFLFFACNLHWSLDGEASLLLENCQT